MTTCVAVLSDDRKAIILVADRLVGYGFVESEPEVRKTLFLHNNWRVMIAGNDIDPVFDIVDRAKDRLANVPTPTIMTVMDTVFECYKDKRHTLAEARFISPRGITLDMFIKEGRKWVPESDYLERLSKIDTYELDLELIVAGFDEQNIGHIFSLESHDNSGHPRRHDVGFYSIGAGSINATFFMAHRELSPKKCVREALYYALEAKYWGESATGVGEDTDICIMRPNTEDLFIGLDTVEEKLIPICYDLRPRRLHRFPKHLRTLNDLEELKDFPAIPQEPQRKKKLDSQKLPKGA